MDCIQVSVYHVRVEIVQYVWVDGYGLSGSACVRCRESVCKICTFDYWVCVECVNGYGILYGNNGNPCYPCAYSWNCD